MLRVAKLPFIYKWLAVMPDAHLGLGATIGSVLPTKGAIIPAAVGVDIGCGMMAVRTSLTASDLPDSLAGIRTALEEAVPHGRTLSKTTRDKGAWADVPRNVAAAWGNLSEDFAKISDKHPHFKVANSISHLGTLGTGNHFLEVCLDQENRVWIMLHSGSRGIGNSIGTYFIELAKKEMAALGVDLPDRDLAYLSEGTESFEDYVEAVGWAQKYAMINRQVMMQSAVAAIRTVIAKPFEASLEAVNCHHNYVAREAHFGEEVFVTRKGAVRAAKGVMGIIPGSMGAKSYIVRGKGNADSFCSCSHGAGRLLSRTEARKRFTQQDQIAATAGIECRKDEGVIDEIPHAYKDIRAVMAAQEDLVEIVHTLRQVVCVKG
jgi:tRNA-splicing ligase RtcB